MLACSPCSELCLLPADPEVQLVHVQRICSVLSMTGRVVEHEYQHSVEPVSGGDGDGAIDLLEEELIRPVSGLVLPVFEDDPCVTLLIG